MERHASLRLVDTRDAFEPRAAFGEKELAEMDDRRRQMAVGAMDDAPAALAPKARHVEHREQAGAQFGLNRLRGQQAD